MKLIIGGAYQGKTDWAKAQYGLTDGDFYTCAGASLATDCPAIRHLERYTLACVQAGVDPCREAELSALADKILICNEIASGLVPMDPTERKWRDVTGHFLALLSKNAESVTRIFCGLPLTLK